MGGVIPSDDKATAALAAAAMAGAPPDISGYNSQISSSAHAASPSQLARLSYGVWVFIDIQLYQLEANNYMVDFKCDGYQNVVRFATGPGEESIEWRPVSKRIKNKEKEVTSPYPYLDVASDLVAQLAVAN